MDVNVVLSKLREAISAAKDKDAEEVASDPALKLRRNTRVDYEPLLELIENFEALDQWLSKGGFLPAEWNKGR